MKPHLLHSWNVSLPEAARLQSELASRVERTDRLPTVRHVGGVDVAYDKESDLIVAAVVILDVESLACIEVKMAQTKAQFDYVPGLFSFRELPAIALALEQLETPPELIVCDGQGIAHPRRFGLACHLGVLFDIPTIGCGKSMLVGVPAPLAEPRGSIANLYDGDQLVGAAVRTQDKVKPVYVSTGNRVALVTACEWILRLASTFRLPETTRQADHAVKLELARISSGVRNR